MLQLESSLPGLGGRAETLIEGYLSDRERRPAEIIQGREKYLLERKEEGEEQKLLAAEYLSSSAQSSPRAHTTGRK